MPDKQMAAVCLREFPKTRVGWRDGSKGLGAQGPHSNDGVPMNENVRYQYNKSAPCPLTSSNG